MDQDTKNVFTPAPMATCKHCAVYFNVQETCFTSAVANKIYKINHQFECNKKCLVYLLTCKKCLKQYVGQTIDTF